MNKEIFLKKLNEAMSNFPSEEIRKAQMYYDEAISDRIEEGLTEQEAVANMGDIDAIVTELKINLPISKLIETSVKTSHQQSTNKGLWLFLIIISFPIWAPILVGFGSTAVTLYITVLALILSMFLVIGSLILVSIVAAIGGVYGLFSGNVLAFIGYAGLSSMAIGLFLMSVHPMLALAKSTFKLPPYLFMKIKQAIFK